MKKFVIFLTTLIFLSLLVNFLLKESERYDYIKQRINKVVEKKKSPAFHQLFDLVDIAENSLVDINVPARKIAEFKSKNERGYVLKGGSVVTYVDTWMLSMEKRVAEKEEIKKMYLEYFQSASSGFYSSSLIFYLLHLLKFSFISFLPLLLSIITSLIPAVAFKYATVMGAFCLMAVIKSPVKAQNQKKEVQKTTETTLLETDFLLDGKGGHFELLGINLDQKTTRVAYFLPNNMMVAAGPNYKLGNGSFSLLGGVCVGSNQGKLDVTDLNLWYIYFGKILNKKVDYVTFGLYNQPFHSHKWWIWSKHQFNIPITEKMGMGTRVDININSEGLFFTYGPSIQFKCNSSIIHFDYKYCKMKSELLVRIEIPIN